MSSHSHVSQKDTVQITTLSPETLAKWMREAAAAQAQAQADERSDSLVKLEPDWIVLDVRSSDFPGGNIRGAINVSSRLFDSPNSIRSIIAQHILPRVQGTQSTGHPSQDSSSSSSASSSAHEPGPPLRHVIVHCMRSQVRGPWCARELVESPDWPRHDSDTNPKVQVHVLEGGYAGWKKLYGTDRALVENLPTELGQGQGQGQGQGEWEDVVEPEEEAHSVELRTGTKKASTSG